MTTTNQALIADLALADLTATVLPEQSELVYRLDPRTAGPS